MNAKGSDPFARHYQNILNTNKPCGNICMADACEPAHKSDNHTNIPIRRLAEAR